MVTSVNTNVGAMVALQNLNATNRDLDEVQNRINTGLRIAGAKDDGSVYAIAQNMRGEVAGYEAVSTSLNNAVAVIDVALAAGEAISDLLLEMKAKAVAATDASLDTASRTALEADFAALRTQIKNIVDNAEFNGTNLLNASLTTYNVLASPGGATITVSARDLRVSASSGLNIGSLSLTTATNASAALSQLNSTIQATNQKLGLLGTSSKSMDIHEIFISKLIDALTSGIGNLVDADLAKESARIQALQIKQQLGTQALSIANQAPQALLNLFQ